VLVDGKLAEGCEWRLAGNEFTQASVAPVPVHNFKHDENYIYSADDIIIDDRIITLMPGTEGQGTALDPPPPQSAQVVKAKPGVITGLSIQ
jgi:hypothetical protein